MEEKYDVSTLPTWEMKSFCRAIARMTEQYFKDPEVQNRIDLLCYECGKEYKKALFELVTTQNSVIHISQKYYVSESLLYRLRKRFYSEWDRAFSDS